MGNTTPVRPESDPLTGTSDRDNFSPFAVGVTVAAAVFLCVGGILEALQGLGAIINDELYVVGEEYFYALDVTTWGWIHLILGNVVFAAGVALFAGAVWARTVAVLVACVSIVANFLWMPYYPLWSLSIIAFNVFVIWAVTAHGRDIAAE